MPILTNSDYQRGIRLASRSSKQPIDLTGFGFELVVKAQRGAAEALLTLTVGAGLTVPDPAAGIVQIAMTAQQTGDVGEGERVWALFRTDGGRRLCLASGKMIFRQGV